MLHFALGISSHIIFYISACAVPKTLAPLVHLTVANEKADLQIQLSDFGCRPRADFQSYHCVGQESAQAGHEAEVHLRLLIK